MRSSSPAAARPGRLQRWWLDRSVPAKGTANIEVVTRFLKTRPAMRLRSVTSGQAGLDAAAGEIPDLILLDPHLPGLHGDEVLRRLRDKSAVIRHLRSSGVIAYLTKPLDLTELGRLLDSVATGHAHGADAAPRTVLAP
jgi:two-component system cell cycle response regulator DivK